MLLDRIARATAAGNEATCHPSMNLTVRSAEFDLDIRMMVSIEIGGSSSMREATGSRQFRNWSVLILISGSRQN